MRKQPLVSLLLASAATLVACSPAYDWRETHPPGAGVSALFPCRPDHHAREIDLAGAHYRMEMLVCKADATTFALAYLDVADAAAVGPALGQLRQAAMANIGASAPRIALIEIAGMTPEAQAGHLSFSGHLPDGAAVQEEAVFFARGRRIYQAAIVGRAPPAEAVQNFIGGLRLPD